MRRRVLCLLLSVFLIVSGVGAVQGSSGDFAIQSDTSISVPEHTETISYNGINAEITITEIAVYKPTDDVHMETSSPSDATTSVTLLNSDRRTYSEKAPDEDGTVNFGDDLPEGGYMAVLTKTDNDGNTIVQDYLPIIVEAYSVDSVTVDGESMDGQEIETDADGELTVELAAHSSNPPTIEEVNVSIWTGETTETVTLETTETNSNTYQGELPALEPDEYDVQIAVGGAETSEGDPEPLGLSESYSLVVTEPASDDDEDGMSGGGGGGGGDSPNDDSSQSSDDDTDRSDDATTDPDSDAETNDSDSNIGNTTEDPETNTTNTTTDLDQPSDDADNIENTTENGAENGAANTTENGADDGTIAPTDTSETEDDVSLFAIQILLASIFVVLTLKRGRRYVKTETHKDSD